mgnify:CR=1 FL=1
MMKLLHSRKNGHESFLVSWEVDPREFTCTFSFSSIQFETNIHTKHNRWGYDVYGRLGLGNHVGPKDPTRPELCPQCKKIESQSRGLCMLPREIEKLRGVQIKSLVCGPAHNMFVTQKSGRLFRPLNFLFYQTYQGIYRPRFEVSLRVVCWV